MIVSVLFFDPQINGYAGNEYVYLTDLPLVRHQKVLAPVEENEKVILKKALVYSLDLPRSAIKPEWADKVKVIKELDV